MQRIRRTRGFTLILAVALIPLVGVAVLLATGQTAQLSRSLRTAERRADEKSLLLSAEVWLVVHRAAVRTAPVGETLAVPITDITRRPATCSADIVAHDAEATVIRLTVTLGDALQTTTAERLLSLAVEG